MPSRNVLIAIAVIVVLAVIAILFYAVGQEAGATGVAATVAAGAEYWRRRGRQDGALDGAIDRASEAVEKLEGIGADADEITDKNIGLVSSTSPEDKAKMIDEVSDS